MTRLRTALWRFAGVKIAPGSLVCGEMTLTGMGDASLLSVGAGCMISGPMHADLGAQVRIGNQVFIGPNATLLTLGHEIGPHERRCGPLAPAPIVIEDGVWIGAHVTVLPGVTIGAGAVIGAGALVTRDIPADTVAVGVPANPVRRIDGQKLRSIRPAPPAFDL